MLSLTPWLAAAICDQPIQTYQGRKIGNIRIDAPLSFLSGGPIRTLLQNSALQSGGTFDAAAYGTSAGDLSQRLGALRVNSLVRVAGRVVISGLENCTEDSIDIVYHVYRFEFPPMLGAAFEGQEQPSSLVGRQPVPSPATRTLNRFMPRPYLGVDSARKFMGGTVLEARGLSGPINSVSLTALQGIHSSLYRFESEGSMDLPTARVLRQYEYRVAARREEQPAAPGAFREARLAAYFAGSSASFGPAGWTFRVGTALEAGTDRVNAVGLKINPADITNGVIGSLKLYAGVTASPGGGGPDSKWRHSLKASYGYQLGKAGDTLNYSYGKRILDAAWSTRWLPWNHRPITLDLQFNRGWLGYSIRVPVPERFFAGNVERDFIEGDSWTIRSQPLLRSVPQNAFNSTVNGGYVGADGFLAFDSTLSFCVWGRPLAPKELTADPTFPTIVNKAWEQPARAIADANLGDLPDFKKITAMIPPLNDALTQASAAIGAVLKIPQLDEDISHQADSIKTRVDSFHDKFAGKNIDDLVPSDLYGAIADVPGDPGEDPIPGQLSSVATSLKALEESLRDAGITQQADTLIAPRKVMQDTYDKVQQDLPALETTQEGQRAKDRAAAEVSTYRHVFNRIIYDMNVVGVSPLVLFDAASLRQRNLPASVRTGSGFGIKVSFFSVDLTFAYAWDRSPWAHRGGAFVFGFSVVDLFR